MSADDQRPIASHLTLRQSLLRLSEYIGLCALVVAQPVLDIYSKSPEEFLNRRFGATQIVTFVVVVVIVPPLIAWSLTTLLSLVNGRAGSVAHKVVLSLLCGLFVLQFVGRTAGPPLSVLLAAITAAAAAFAFFRWEGARRFPRYLAPVPFILAGLFLFASDVTPIVQERPSRSDEALEASVGNPAPVVMLVFDELPMVSLLDGSGRIDESLYPNFARLAAGSTWYRNTTTVGGLTNFALPAILSGSVPPVGGAPLISDVYRNSLFSMLGNEYSMNVQEPVSRICPGDLCTPYTKTTGSLPEMWGQAATLWADPLLLRSAPEKSEGPTQLFYFPEDIHDPARIDTFVSSLSGSSNPKLHYLHLMLPHVPFEFTSDGKVCSDGQPKVPKGAVNGKWTNAYAAQSARARHLTQLQYTDQRLGEILDQLQSDGLWDDAVIIAVSDHGMSFDERFGFRDWNKENLDQLLFVPLMIRAPGLAEGRVDDRAASTLDVLPTIAELLEAEIPFEVDGSSLLGPPPQTGYDKAVADRKLVEFDRRTAFAKVLRSSATKGPASDPLRLSRFGDHADLVGRDVASLVDGESKLTASVAAPGTERTYDPADNAVDCFVKATVTPGAAHDIAIAVNGKVAAVAPSDPRTGEVWAVLPESLIESGTFTVSLFEMESTRGRVALRSIG